jgi:solute carrier family 25 2-oxodicarboxylate transporter 21
MEAPKRATKFAANDEWGKVYRNLFGVTKMNQSLSILTGASAGATEAFVVVPFELVKIRLQGKHRKLKSRRRSVTNNPNRQGASLPVLRPS